MNEKSAYIPIHELEVYRLSRKLSTSEWTVYQRLSFQEKKVWGDQMLSAINSVGANIAEGYARFHFSEKSRFYYISRASLSEGVEHWIDLGFERGVVSDQEFLLFNQLRRDVQVRLNNMIKSTYSAKNQLKDNS
ncbi:four helix bundle protein [Algoriphagus halophilus]|uniref:four helix bundle protein n=1 Tax=Algoriphagus halophilus TaxID=226505 RepID=UPI00358E2E42